MALIESGLLTQLRDDLDYKIHHDDTIHYYENDIPAEDPDHRGMKKPRAVSAVTERLSSQVYEYAKDGKFVLTLGGDHSIAIGTVSGTAKAIRERLGREMAVIWVDAHADINLPEMSPSGNIHGMPMAFLTRLAREDRPDIFGWLKDEHIVSTRKLVYIGLRDVDRGEKQILREHGIKAFSMHDIDRYVFAVLAPLINSHSLCFCVFFLSLSLLFLFLSVHILGAQANASSPFHSTATELAVLSRWPWPTLATTLPFTSPLTSMRWTPSGPPALAPPSVED